MTSRQIRVIVVDDHPLVRRGTCEMVAEAADMAVVGEGASGEAALDLAALEPDVLLLDIHMPRMDGLAVVQALRALRSRIGILMLTAADDEGAILKALRAGANGYLLKTATEEELHQAIRLVVDGETAIVQPAVARVLANASQAPAPQPLSERELDVLRALTDDLGNKEIATRLGISDRTVQQHLANIFGKLGVSSRTGAVLKGLQLGYLKLEDAHV